MKVIVSGYIGRKITGIGRNLINLLSRIQREDMEFVVYTNNDIKDQLVFDNPNITIKTYNVSCENSIGNLLWTTFIFPFMAIKEKADVTLITNFTLLLFPVKPTVIFLHDMTEYKVPGKQSKLRVFYRTKLAIPISARNAKRIVTVSKNSQKDILEILNVKEEKIDFVYNGIDRKSFTRLDQEVAQEILKKRALEPPFILFVGTIDHPGRNLVNLVRAFEMLKNEKQYTGKLILVGRSGKGAQIVKDYIEKSKYRDEIIIAGYISDEELKALYSLCDVFCYLSLYEGFGMPPVEALASGAKVVVSNTSALPEAVGDVGTKVEPNDIENIAEGIIKTINQPMDDAFKQKIENHLKKFSWDVEAEKLAQVLLKAKTNKIPVN